MVLIQNSCHDCHKLIAFQIEQTAINNKLRWYISYNCHSCESSTEFDELGFPPEEIRQEILKHEGEWEIIIENCDRQKQTITESFTIRKLLFLCYLKSIAENL